MTITIPPLSAQIGSTLAGLPQGRISHRAIVLGDSTSVITAPPGETLLTGSFPTVGDGWFADVCARSLGSLKPIGNAGVSGEDSGDILARVDTDVVALAPDLCFVLVGNNDPVNGLTFAESKANYIAITEALLTAGILPIICTITPRTHATLTWHAAHGRLNQFWRKVANDYGLPLIDFHSVLVDPLNGDTLAGTTDDGIHQRTILGIKTMSDHAVNVLDDLGLWRTDVYSPLPQKLSEVWTGTGDTTSGSASVANFTTSTGIPMSGMPIYGTGIPAGTYIGTIGGGAATLVTREGVAVNATASGSTVSLSASDPQNILGDPSNPTRHGLMITDAGSGVADGWAKGGGGAANCTTTLPPDAAIPGNWQKLVQSVSGTTVMTFTTVNDQGFLVGDRVAFMGRFKAVAEAGSMEYSFTVTNTSATGDPSTVSAIDRWPRDIDAGWFYFEYVVPAGTRRFSIQARIESGTGELWYAQIGLLNLTANGLA